MNCSGADVADVLKVLEVIPEADGKDSSKYVRVSASGKQISFALAGDLRGELSVPATDVVQGTNFLLRSHLMGFMAGATEKMTLAFEKGYARIRCGRRSASIALAAKPVGGYGTDVKLTGKELLLKKAQIDELDIAGRYAVEVADAPQLGIVYIDGKSGSVYASNKNTYFSSESAFSGTVPIPKNFASMFTVSTAYRIGEREARLEYPRGYMIQSYKASKFPLTLLLDGFAMCKKMERRLILPIEEIQEAVARLSKLGAEGWVRLKSDGREVLFTVDNLGSTFRERLKPEKMVGEFEEHLRIDSITPFIETAPAKSSLEISFLKTKSPFLLELTHTSRKLMSPRMLPGTKPQ